MFAGGPQFFRVQTYALERSATAARNQKARAEKARKAAGKSKSAGVARRMAKWESNEKGGWTVADIVAEATRQPGHCEHVDQPLPPAVIEGVDPMEIPAMISADVKAARKELRGSGTRIRGDTRSLVTYVGSFPLPTALLDADPANREAYETWKRDHIAFVKAEAAAAGAEVVSVVEHLDEGFPHIHAYALPRQVRGYRADAVHPGAAARTAAVAAGADPFAAYREAMEAAQNRYSEAVGAPNGLTRFGPHRRDRFPDRRAYLAHRDEITATARRRVEADARLVAATEHAAALVMAADEEAHATRAMADQDAGQILAYAQEEAATIQRAADADRREALTLREQAQRLLDGLRQRFDGVAARFDALVRGGTPQAAPTSADLTKQALGRVFGQSSRPLDGLDALAADLLGPTVRKPAAAEAAARLGSWRRDHDQQPAATRQMGDGSPPEPPSPCFG